jgi:hypothetical protein
MEAMEYESIEGLESESESESESEAAQKSRWPTPRGATGAGLYRPRVTSAGPPVSQVQLQALTGRISDQLKKNSGAIATVNNRVNTVNTSEKKDNTDRKKDLKAINEKIQLLSLLPLLIKPKTQTITADTAGLTKDSKVLVDSGDTLSALLPLLLVGGLGSGGLATGSEGGSMDGSMLLILALALSGSLNPK